MYLIFVVDASVIFTLPEVFVVLFFSLHSLYGLPPVVWAMALLVMAVTGEATGNTLLYWFVKRLLVRTGRMPKRIETLMRRWMNFLILHDERIILLNRVIPVVPFVGAFIAALKWNYPKSLAFIVIDTSELNVHELRDRLREIIGEPADMPSGLQINVVSFGYKHGLPLDVDLVFDCRFLPNPHWIESLRPLPGTDAKVRRYVMKQEETQAFLEELSNLFELLLPAYVREGKSYLSIGVGCTGGRHRSVVIAAEIARLLERLGFPARVHHRDLERE